MHGMAFRTLDHNLGGEVGIWEGLEVLKFGGGIVVIYAPRT